ncbi:MAG: ABC transporter ATP-binding protein [Polyangiaceae bacterium]
MVEVEGLVVSYDQVRAVDGLTLEVPKGCLFGLLGPNGAGKSTTISAIGGLIAPSAGKVTVGGVDVARDPLAARRRLGIAPQSLALFPNLTVKQNLQVFGGLFGLGGRKLTERTSWGLQLAQLEAKRDQPVASLSGGMKRRLNLACALLHDPEVVICDEPTTGVDPQSRNHLFDTIRGLHAEGRTVIYTTHYMEEVEALCERVAIVDHGRVIAEDSLEALVATSAAQSFTVELREGCALGTLERELASLPVAAIRENRRSLEQVFLELTGRGLRDGDA